MYNMTSLLLISTLLTSHLWLAAGQAKCTTPSGKIGDCVSIFSCKSLLELTVDGTPENLDILTKSLCNTNEGKDTVCCPAEPCTISNGTQGTCVSSQSCPYLQNLGAGSCLDREKVCCVFQLTSRIRQEGECQLTATPPDPSSNCCGFDARTGPKVYGGTATNIDEYPWMALLEYRRDGDIVLKCGGVLISGQYVLTAAHCIGPKSLRPVSVRLGEYNTDNPGKDCVPVAGGGDDCTDGALSVPIDKIMVHSNFSRLPLKNDIALIKLTRTINYTDFIRPICLPTVDFTVESSANVDLYTAGWGETETESWSNIKMKVTLPYVPNESCQSSYTTRLFNYHMCAGGEKGKDSCRGDSGGPLMRELGNRHELIGILSFGSVGCGTEGVPGVYIKVFEYLPWIRSQIGG